MQSEDYADVGLGFENHEAWKARWQAAVAAREPEVLMGLLHYGLNIRPYEPRAVDFYLQVADGHSGYPQEDRFKHYTQLGAVTTALVAHMLSQKAWQILGTSFFKIDDRQAWVTRRVSSLTDLQTVEQLFRFFRIGEMGSCDNLRKGSSDNYHYEARNFLKRFLEFAYRGDFVGQFVRERRLEYVEGVYAAEEAVAAAEKVYLDRRSEIVSLIARHGFYDLLANQDLDSVSCKTLYNLAMTPKFGLKKPRNLHEAYAGLELGSEHRGRGLSEHPKAAEILLLHNFRQRENRLHERRLREHKRREEVERHRREAREARMKLEQAQREFEATQRK